MSYRDARRAFDRFTRWEALADIPPEAVRACLHAMDEGLPLDGYSAACQELCRKLNQAVREIDELDGYPDAY